MLAVTVPVVRVATAFTSAAVGVPVKVTLIPAKPVTTPLVSFACSTIRPSAAMIASTSAAEPSIEDAITVTFPDVRVAPAPSAISVAKVAAESVASVTTTF